MLESANTMITQETKSKPTPAHPETQEQRVENHDKKVEQRLDAVYQFISELVKLMQEGQKVERVLDIGTWKGVFVKRWLTAMAEHVYSFDLDTFVESSPFPQLKKLRTAQKLLKEEIAAGIVHLFQMDALKMSIAPESVQVVTCIEVLGAGLEGSTEKVNELLEHIFQTLRKDGVAILTFRSQSADDALINYFGNLDPETSSMGLTMHRQDLPALKKFRHRFFLGQMIMRYEPGQPIVLLDAIPTFDEEGKLGVHPTAEKYKPRLVEENEKPRYWVVVLGKEKMPKTLPIALHKLGISHRGGD